jgi:enoyl-CoA hydratase
MPVRALIRSSDCSGVTLLQLDNPPANAVDTKLALELAARIDAVNHDDDARCVVIGSAGTRFSLGADVKALASSSMPEVRQFLRAIRDAFDAVAACRVPTIAAIDGLATGGGAELALSCDIRVMSSAGSFGLPEVKLGLLPGAGGTQRLVDVAGSATALDLMLTGRTIGSGDALRLGIVSLVAEGAALPSALEVAGQIATYPAEALARIRSVIEIRRTEGRAIGFRAEGAAIRELIQSSEAQAAMSAFVQRSRRKPRSTGVRHG